MSRVVRVGLIGAGPARTWAARAHIPALRALPDVEIVAVATSRRESAQAAARLTGARYAFTDGRRLAEHRDVDVVAVVVKVTAHAELVGAALAAGKHVYCEWPLGVNLAQAADLAAQAERAGVVHVIGLQGRHSPHLLTARDIVAEGRIGRVLSCDLRHSTGHRGGARVSANAVWGLSRAAGRNLLTIQGGHSLDALCLTVGAHFSGLSALVATRTPAATVIETGERVAVDTPDQVIVAGELTNNVCASVHLQGGAPAAEGFQMDIHGDRGVLSLSGAGAHNCDLAMRGVVDGAAVDSIPPASRYLPAPAGGLANPAGNVARLYASLVNQIRSGQVTGPSFADAVAVHGLLQAIQDSSEGGCYQIVPPVNGSEERTARG